jgi:hypothetical protein
MSEFSAYSDPARRSLSPLVVAVAAWLLSRGEPCTVSKLDTLIALYFPNRTGARYASKYTEFTLSEAAVRRSRSPESIRLLEEGILDSTAMLRKIVVATTPGSEFSDDLAFESDAVFQAGARAIEGASKTLDSLADYELRRCPHCKLVGEVSDWFGWRLVSGRQAAQSWCQLCRTDHQLGQERKHIVASPRRPTRPLGRVSNRRS